MNIPVFCTLYQLSNQQNHTMKKIFLAFTALLAFAITTACKSGSANDTATTHETTWSTIEDKLANGAPLDEADCLFILTDTTLDDGHSEGIGNYLFNHLCGYRKHNNLFIDTRKHFPSEVGDENMLRLMDLMSVDIAVAEYEDYEEFLDDFPMFRGCSGAEDEFNWIKENAIDIP